MYSTECRLVNTPKAVLVGGRVITSIGLSFFLSTIFQKLMQLGSPNLT